MAQDHQISIFAWLHVRFTDWVFIGGLCLVGVKIVVDHNNQLVNIVFIAIIIPLAGLNYRRAKNPKRAEPKR
jgi:hypothetical protein